MTATEQNIDKPDMYCRKCQYILNNLDRNRCPECGHEFDPTDPSTYLNCKIERKPLIATILAILSIIPLIITFDTFNALRNPDLHHAVPIGIFTLWAIYWLAVAAYGCVQSLRHFGHQATTLWWAKKSRWYKYTLRTTLTLAIIAVFSTGPYMASFLVGWHNGMTHPFYVMKYTYPKHSFTGYIYYRQYTFWTNLAYPTTAKIINQYLADEQYEKAINFAAVRYGWYNQNLQQWIVRTWLKAGKPDKALERANDTIELFGQSPQNCVLRARAYLAQENFDLALEDINKAIELDPDNHEAICYLGNIHIHNKQYSDAIAAYQKSLDIKPESAWSHNALAWHLATCPDDSIRDGQSALYHARHACELTEWKNSSIAGTLAAAYAEIGDYPNAITTLEKAIELDPEFAADKRKEMMACYISNQPYRDTREYQQ